MSKVYHYQGQRITDLKEWCRGRGEDIIVVRWKRLSPRATMTDKGLVVEMKEWCEEEEMPESVWMTIPSVSEHLGSAEVVRRYKP